MNELKRRNLRWVKNTKWIFGIVMIVLIGLLTACGAEKSAGESSNNKTVKIGYQKGNTLHLLKVKETLDERLAEENVKVEWSEFPIGTALLEGLNTGAIDFGHASDANGVFSQASGKTSLYVASDTPYPKGVALVVKESSPIKSIVDVKGRK